MPIRVQKIQLTSGEVMEVASGLTVIVGPNNVGKTVLLSELHDKLSGQGGSRALVASRVEFERTHTIDQLLEWLDKTYGRRKPGIFNVYSGGEQKEPSYKPHDGEALPESQIRTAWASPHHLGMFSRFVLKYLTTRERLNMPSQSESFNLHVDRPANPVQHLYMDRTAEKQASDFMMRAFGSALTVDRYAGNTVTLYIGTATTPETGPPPTEEYLKELAGLPKLLDQGDGIRAFMGIALAIITTHYPLVIIDEPEAFLHPPHAYLLGRILAEQHPRGTQVIVATHSVDVLRGVTEADAGRGTTSVVRLTRDNAGNHAAQVPAGTVGGLYNDPLVKYYGILDGLFYHGVVLCEGDSDCTYYRAVLDSIERLDDGTPVESISLHFTHCGGKARLPKAVQALRSAKVPVACIADLDLLRDDSDFNGLVTACGGDPAALKAWRNDVTSAINSGSVNVKRAVARAEIEQILSARAAAELSAGEIENIKAAVTAHSRWKDAKKQGERLLSGQALDSFQRLCGALRELGIFLVELGVLESFHRKVPANNKAEWLRKVLEQKKYLESPDAHALVKAVTAHILSRQ